MHDPILITGWAGGVAEILISRQDCAVEIGHARRSATGDLRQQELGVTKDAPTISLEMRGVAHDDFGLVLVDDRAVSIDRVRHQASRDVICPKFLIRLRKMRRTDQCRNFAIDQLEEIGIHIRRCGIPGLSLFLGDHEFNQRRRQLFTHLDRTQTGPRIGRQLAHQGLETLFILSSDLSGFGPMLIGGYVFTDHMRYTPGIPATEGADPTPIIAFVRAGLTVPSGDLAARRLVLGDIRIEGAFLAIQQARTVFRAGLLT